MSLEIIISYNSSGPSSNYANVFDMNMGVFQFGLLNYFQIMPVIFELFLKCKDKSEFSGSKTF